MSKFHQQFPTFPEQIYFAAHIQLVSGRYSDGVLLTKMLDLNIFLMH